MHDIKQKMAIFALLFCCLGFHAQAQAELQVQNFLPHIFSFMQEEKAKHLVFPVYTPLQLKLSRLVLSYEPDLIASHPSQRLQDRSKRLDLYYDRKFVKRGKSPLQLAVYFPSQVEKEPDRCPYEMKVKRDTFNKIGTLNYCWKEPTFGAAYVSGFNYSDVASWDVSERGMTGFLNLLKPATEISYKFYEYKPIQKLTLLLPAFEPETYLLSVAETYFLPNLKTGLFVPGGLPEGMKLSSFTLGIETNLNYLPRERYSINYSFKSLNKQENSLYSYIQTIPYVNNIYFGDKSSKNPYYIKKTTKYGEIFLKVLEFSDDRYTILGWSHQYKFAFQGENLKVSEFLDFINSLEWVR